MLDGVAAGRDGVLQALAAKDMAACLLAETMGFIDQRLQDRQRIGRHIVDVAGRREGIGPTRKQLDPIDAALDVLAHRRAALFGRGDAHAGQWVHRDSGRNCGSPDDAAARHHEPRAFEAALVDGVAHLHVGVAVAMRAHVTRCGEARAQVSLQIVDGDQRRGLPRHARPRIVEHMGSGRAAPSPG